MRKYRKLAELHVYQKVIIVFVVLMAPVFLTNLWMNKSGMSFMKEGYANSILSNVNFYSSQLNDQIAFVRMQQLQLLGDSDVQRLGFLGEQLSETEDILLVNRVAERVATIRNSSDYLLNVGISIKSIGKTISTQNRITSMPNPESELIARYIDNNPGQPLYYDDGRLFFIETSNNGNIIAFLELSITNLSETLNRLVGLYEDSGVLLANEKYGNVVSVNARQQVLDRLNVQGDHEYSNQAVESYLLKTDKQSYLITHTPVSSLGLTLFAYMNQDEVTGPLKKFNTWYVILSVISLTVVILFSFSVNLMIHKPLKKLIQAFKRLETDNLITSLRNQSDNEFGYLYRNFDRMVEKLGQSIEENYEQKMALQHSELKQLQSQINPHFLYNSFFNLYMICRSGDLEAATTLAQKLGSYYQFITRSGKDEVPLKAEYQHALDYCEIQSIRFSNRITVEASDISEACEAWEVPRIIIQPLVENAFEYAFTSVRRAGIVRVYTTLQDKRLSIVVEDDGQDVTEELIIDLQTKLTMDSPHSEKTGLVNVSRRVRLKFGEQSGVVVSRSSLGGLKAEIIIYYND